MCLFTGHDLYEKTSHSSSVVITLVNRIVSIYFSRYTSICLSLANPNMSPVTGTGMGAGSERDREANARNEERELREEVAFDVTFLSLPQYFRWKFYLAKFSISLNTSWPFCDFC